MGMRHRAIGPLAGALLAAVLAAGGSAGCGTPGAATPGRAQPPMAASAQTSAPAQPSATASRVSPVAALCGDPNAPGRLITLRAADGVRIAAATAGSGRRGVVLIPELGRSGMCGWWAYAAYLSGAGFRVVIFDHRCTGGSGCPSGAAADALMPDIRAAVGWLRRAGAAKVALLGASQGGAEAVIAGAAPAPGVTGVVALSADELTQRLARPPYPRTAMAGALRLRLPALFAVARGDPYVSVGETRRLVARAGSPVKRLVVLPTGSGHGWDLVIIAPSGPPNLARAVRAFLARVTS